MMLIHFRSLISHEPEIVFYLNEELNATVGLSKLSITRTGFSLNSFKSASHQEKHLGISTSIKP